MTTATKRAYTKKALATYNQAFELAQTDASSFLTKHCSELITLTTQLKGVAN